MTDPTSAESARPENRLARQQSPYLLQHRHNPVDWYPWGEEAFARARAEGKPIFLSIGYSTCHWCHVMERESFEDPATAAVLNRHFVSIKVDREERPDVDKIYMTYVQARTGSGGWPLNVFLTPEREPFYGGTYWPPSGRHGRPGFTDVLEQLARLWNERRGEVVSAAREMTEALRVHAARAATPGNGDLTPAVLEQAAARMKEEYDPRHGGFGGAPKFPRPCQPAFLLREAWRTGDREAVRMVLHTCDRMAAGGMHDQLGGGFARYSVDAAWLVPHFEKMLYDNAQLVHLYLDACLVSGEARYAEVVRSTIGYVLGDMTHPEGGFYSAEDADSEGQEGKFYGWTLEELRRLLPADELAVVTRYYGVTEAGNFEDHSHPEPLRGLNVLSVVEEVRSEADASRLASARERMRAARARRVRPHLDDKILTSWNGLMLGALSRASAVLGEPAWRQAAERNLAFLKERLWEEAGPDGDGILHHRWREGERDQARLLDDHAFLLDGVLHLYEATLEPAHLEFALRLADAMIRRFHDARDGGFWQSAAETPDLILRLKEDYDGAEPSGNSVAALALLKLAVVADRPDLREAATGTLRLFGERLRQLPQALPQMLQALAFELEEPWRVVVAGEAGSPGFQELLRSAHGVYRPDRVILGTAGPVEPLARSLIAREGRATAYLCTGTACQPPTADPAELRRRLAPGVGWIGT